MNRLIVAIDNKRGMAKDGVMPWRIPEDSAYFTKMTKTFGGNVLSGRKTFANYQNGPLEGRQNYVLTTHGESIPGVTLVHNLEQFLQDFSDKDVWIAGGAKVFQEVIDANLADELYITHIDEDFNCDQFFPEYESKFQLIKQSEIREQNGHKFRYAIYAKK